MRSGGPGFECTCTLEEETMPNENCTPMDRLPTSWTLAKTSAHAMHKNRTWTASLSKSRRQSWPNTLVSGHLLSCPHRRKHRRKCPIPFAIVKDGKTFYTVHNHASRKWWLRTSRSRREVSSECCGDHHSTQRQSSLTMTHSLRETNPSFGRIETFQGQLQRVCRRDAARLKAPDWPAHACALGALCRITGSHLQWKAVLEMFLGHLFMSTFSCTIRKWGVKLVGTNHSLVFWLLTNFSTITLSSFSFLNIFVHYSKGINLEA